MRQKDAGLVLFNVLVMTALMALIVMSMLSIESVSLTRSQAFSEAGYAITLSRAAEESVIEALIVDAAESPDVDHAKERWSLVSQQEIAIDGGSFALSVLDAQSLYNLRNVIAAPNPQARVAALLAVEKLLKVVDLSSAQQEAFHLAVRRAGSDASLYSIAEEAGLTTHLRALESVLILLPEPTLVNVNTAPPAVLEAVLENPAQVRLVQSIKKRKGFLSGRDLTELGFLAGLRITTRSNYFKVIADLRIGQTRQVVQSMIYRQTKDEEQADPIVFSRTRLPSYP